MMNQKSLFIWGAGGHAKVVLDVAQAVGFDDIRFLDDASGSGDTLLGCKVLRRDFAMLSVSDALFVVAIGHNELRAKCFQLAVERGWRPATLVHPAATVSLHARLGAGTVVMPRVVVNAASSVGRNCILNTGAIVEHDCTIGDHVHISPAATLGGNVTVGSFSQIGMSASVLPGRTVGSGALVGAGAVATRAIGKNVTAIGIPARVMKTQRVIEIQKEIMHELH